MDTIWFLTKTVIAAACLYWILSALCVGYFFWGIKHLTITLPYGSFYRSTSSVPQRPDRSLSPTEASWCVSQPVIIYTLWYLSAHYSGVSWATPSPFFESMHWILWGLTILPCVLYIMARAIHCAYSIFLFVCLAGVMSWTPYFALSFIESSHEQYRSEVDKQFDSSHISLMALGVTYGIYAFVCYPVLPFMNLVVLMIDEAVAKRELTNKLLAEREQKAEAERAQREIEASEQKADQVKREAEERAEQERREAEYQAQQLLEVAQRGIPLRENGLLDLALFRAAETLLGPIDWTALPEAPHYAKWFAPDPELVHKRYDARQDMSQQYLYCGPYFAVYPKAAFEKDCELLFHPEHPYFLTTSAGGNEARLNTQNDSLCWVLTVVKEVADIVEMRRVYSVDIPRSMSDAELIIYLRALLFSDRHESQIRLREISKALRNHPKLDTDLKCAVRHAKTRAIMFYQKRINVLGPFLSKEEFEGEIERTLSKCDSINMVDFHVEWLQAWMERKALRCRVEQEYKAAGGEFTELSLAEFYQLVDDQMAHEFPVDHVREMADAISERIKGLTRKPSGSVEKRKQELIRQRESVFTDYDATIVDEQQREMAQERYDNRVFLPAMEALGLEVINDYEHPAQ